MFLVLYGPILTSFFSVDNSNSLARVGCLVTDGMSEGGVASDLVAAMVDCKRIRNRRS